MIILPKEMKDLLKSMPGPQCIMTNIGDLAAVVVKLDRPTIRTLKGNIPIGVRPEAGLYPDTGSVIRIVIDFFGDEQINMDTFLNPASPLDMVLLQKLQQQTVFQIHFFNDRYVEYEGSKQIPWRSTGQKAVADVVNLALENNKNCTSLDFPSSKAKMMEETE